MESDVSTTAPARQRDTDTVAKQAIRNAVKMADHHGIKVNAQMEKVEGRVLPAPKLAYSRKVLLVLFCRFRKLRGPIKLCNKSDSRSY